MSNTMIMPNRHLVDRLADAKVEKDRAERVYNELRAEVLETRDLIGDEHVADVKDTKRTTLDRAALESVFGKDALLPFVKTADVVVVSVRRRPPALKIGVFRTLHAKR
jgi:hypothetical protein